MRLKDFSYRLLNRLHVLIFKEQIGPEALQFFTGTSYVAIGTLFGSLLTFVFYIIAARIMGATNFGNLALVMTMSSILAIPMGLSMVAGIKYGAEAVDDYVRSLIISTLSWQIALFTLGSIVIYVLFSAQLSRIFGVSAELYLFALVYAALVVFFTLTTSLLRILFRIRTVGVINAVQSAITLVAFLGFVSVKFQSWQAAAFSFYIGYAVLAVVFIFPLRRYIKLQFDWLWSRKLVNYALPALPGTAAVALMGIDKILINKFITAAAVGIYNAYYVSSIVIAASVFSIVNVAFFPLASRSRNKLEIFRKVNVVAPYLAAALLPSFTLIEFVVFIFYGSQYHFSIGLGLLFAVASTAYFFFFWYGYIMASEGTSGAKVFSISTIIAAAVIIGLNAVLLPFIGILGAAFALVCAYLAAFTYLVSRWRVLNQAGQTASNAPEMSL